MIKIIETRHSTNFVDENNIMLGYEDDIQCCEHPGYFLVKKIDDAYVVHGIIDAIEAHLEQYSFTGSYGTSEVIEDELMKALSSYDDFRWIQDVYSENFELINNAGEKACLYLYNVHNGYYSHGFEFKKDSKMIVESSL